MNVDVDSNEAGNFACITPLLVCFIILVFLFNISTSRLNLSIKLMSDSAKKIDRRDPLPSLSNWIVGFPFHS